MSLRPPFDSELQPAADALALELSVFRPRDGVVNAPVLYTLHGGGMVMGNRFFFLDELGQLDWVRGR